VLRKLGDDAGSLALEEQARDPRTPATAEDHFQLGELFRLNQVVRVTDVHPPSEPVSALRDENLKRAVEEYRRALNQDPRHYWAHFQLGRCYLGLGRHNEAIETLGACIALRPDTPWAYSVRGLALGLQEQFTQSRADLDKALQLDPRFLPARLNRGVIAWLESRPNEAISDFDFVLGVSEENRLIEAAFYRAQIHLEKQDYARALTDLNRVVAETPDFRPVYELRARVQFLLGSDTAGWTDLNFYLALATTGSFDPDSSTALEARSRVVRSWATALPFATKARIFAQARQELQMAVTRAPVNVALYAELGALEELVGQPKAAIDAYSRVLVISPESVQVRNQRGWAYVSQEKYELALEDFRAALVHEPQNGEAHTGCGYVLAQQGHLDAARDAAARAALCGGNQYLVLHNVACIYAELAQHSDANASEYENLALIFLERGVELGRLHRIGPNAVDLIRSETAFSPSLRLRPEFQRLVESRQ
jgi:tetratricopeptide (TPR) repeat protein